MNDDEDRTRRSPWHAGERRLQTLAGVEERMEQVGRRVIRERLPDQHRAFYEALPFIVLGAVDAGGRAWATLLEGPPGFMRSPDPRRLELDRLPPLGDPTRDGIAEGAAVALLGIELTTRRRNRMNGRVQGLSAGGFTVEVEHAFGNCPRYIRRREPFAAPVCPDRAVPSTESLSKLDADAHTLIAAADTAFVASYVDSPADGIERSVDVSHRGGRPGFAHVKGDRVTLPDFAGNRHFNTLGNLLLNPRAGLVFVDFETGDMLHLYGHTTLVLAGPELDRFAGAERMWTLEVETAVRRRAALSLRLRCVEPWSQELETGTGAEAGRSDRTAHADAFAPPPTPRTQGTTLPTRP